MKIILLVVSLFVLGCTLNAEAGPINGQLLKRDTMADHKQEWEEYKTKFNKSYDDPAEDKRRFDLYQESVGLVNAHNEKYKKGEVSYELGINHFSDLTPEERSRRTGKLSLPKKD